MNTVFLSVMATIIITCIMATCYCWGYEEGRQKGAMESDIENCHVVVEKIITNLEEHGDEFIESVMENHDQEHENRRRVITHADLVAFEEAHRQKEQKEKGADK